jgi:hypothetical protein
MHDGVIRLAEENRRLKRKVTNQRKELRNLHKAHNTLWKVLNLAYERMVSPAAPKALALADQIAERYDVLGGKGTELLKQYEHARKGVANEQ